MEPAATRFGEERAGKPKHTHWAGK